ncbi:hypothetical protein [Clostridium sp.]|uniref:hypothetical protein n=1 Tax=Clostridium sp. TaxID=1506 RepID=UPI003F2A937A
MKDKEEEKTKFEEIFNNYKKTMYYVANSILKYAEKDHFYVNGEKYGTYIYTELV